MLEDDKSTHRQNELSEYHKLGRSLLHDQTRAIDALIHDLAELDNIEESVKIRIPILMLQAVGVSTHSVLTLTQERNMSIRDCFGIARSAFETAVNAAFISVLGDQMAEKAIRHMRQKRWRDLRRQGRMGDQLVTVSRNINVEIDAIPQLREALEEYTNKKGEEIRDWTPISLERRVAAVSRQNHRAGLCLGAAMFSIYRPASELLHGTYYGVNLFWQGSRDEPARRREEFDELWVTEHFVTLLTALFFSISGAIHAISSASNLSQHSQMQDHLSNKLSTLATMLSSFSTDKEHEFQVDRV